MKAVTFHGPHDLRYEEVPDPTLPDERSAIVRVTLAAICGSDLHTYHGDMPPSRAGMPIGHEAIGEVLEVGARVTRVKPGDRVMISGCVGCGTCPRCYEGDFVLCERFQFRVPGLHGLGGAQAELMAVPCADYALGLIPDGISDDQALMLTDACPTGYMGAKRAEIRPGDAVAVIGQGPIGRSALEAAFLFGPSTVFALDRVPERLAGAEAMGAVPVNVDEVDPVSFIRQRLGGLGPQRVIEAVGPDATVALALRLCRAGGTVSMIGASVSREFPLNLGFFQWKHLTFRASLTSVPLYWETLIPLVREGRLRPERMITHRFPLSEGPEAFRLFDERREGVMKVVLEP